MEVFFNELLNYRKFHCLIYLEQKQNDRSQFRKDKICCFLWRFCSRFYDKPKINSVKCLQRLNQTFIAFPFWGTLTSSIKPNITNNIVEIPNFYIFGANTNHSLDVHNEFVSIFFSLLTHFPFTTTIVAIDLIVEHLLWGFEAVNNIANSQAYCCIRHLVISLWQKQNYKSLNVIYRYEFCLAFKLPSTI